MIVSATNIGKRYGINWIFKDLRFEFSSGDTIALTGNNGSGKSTLLQIIAGYLTPTTGSVLLDGDPIGDKELQIGFVGPYAEIIEEYTLGEFLAFHEQFRKKKISFREMAGRASLPLNRSISEFSTGMKQRAKLLTVFHFVNEMLFMDEPTANLDEEGIAWWQTEMESREENLITFIASNQSQEIRQCSKKISLKKM